MKNKLWQGILHITYACTISIFITACSTLPQTTLSESTKADYYNARATAVGKLQEWDVEGKIAVYIDNKNNHGNLTWRQRSNTFDLLITGPLGQGYLHIEGRPGAVLATTAEEQIQATSIEELFANHFEWTFPMRELLYWVRGIASPASTAKLAYSDTGDLSSIEQAGWQIEYGPYTQVKGLSMPNKMTIKGKAIKLKLVLKNWANLQPVPGQ
ncbi:MAG: lipoprotein insertase outer membrane protein LolB [Gammaproteobacteria bacterium]|jgi:outer membrane lipoprotein LolB|nr:lipoprotein insertase outer membrane protein LolB [Gammaproteobacteria bacterium]